MRIRIPTKPAYRPSLVGAPVSARSAGPRHNGSVKRLPRGASTYAAQRFIEEIERRGDLPHGVIVVERGEVTGEAFWYPYGPDKPHELYSLSKSFTSTAIGFAVSEGLVSLDRPIIAYFPTSAPAAPSENLKAMRVRDLLAMATGHLADDMNDLWNHPGGDMVAGFLARPVPFNPGTHFLYNTSASFVLSALVQRVTGKTVTEYLTPRLFEPLGFASTEWEKSPGGVDMGGFGLNLVLEDVAKFGETLLRDGVFEGRRVMPEGWVALASSSHVSNGTDPNSDWNQGYGFQFWRCKHGAFRGDGAFGQYCIVMPERETVLAVFSNTPDMQRPLNTAYEFFAPRLIPFVAGNSAFRPGFAKSFAMDDNPLGITRIGLRTAECGFAFEFRDGRGDQRIEIGAKDWCEGRSWFRMRGEKRVRARGGWVSENEFRATLCYDETPFHPTLVLTLDGEAVTLRVEGNCGFVMPPDPGPIRGKVLE